ncbi:hypothetical protein SB6411_02064 [Klebsiella spallanzanii]|jgi:hypothetical protein|uniref:Lipoprotein n=1 Tax=Klebsiella spallanzanii TaxID=2587528 RepID=A0ABY6VEG7_9ENTR|nr:hypothetical protein [Klebsiella spallanzanii]MDM4206457.1 hypothetical protein [Klebsiella spallanzanii]VUS64655.1 hypothetical protein SB6411_02064 [Klebsiella spallanzanii]
MCNKEKWGKLFFFIGLSFISCSVSAALLKPDLLKQQLQDACSRTQDPAQARLCHSLLIYQHAQQRQRYLHFLLQQNIFSIQTYDYLWSEYQRTVSCAEISRFLVTKAQDSSIPSLPFTLLPPYHELSEPPAVFALQESIN